MDLIGLNPRKYFFCGTLPAFVRCFFSVNKNPNRCLFHRFLERSSAVFAKNAWKKFRLRENLKYFCEDTSTLRETSEKVKLL
jgi:hypothetical protein